MEIGAADTFRIGGDLEVHRLGFGAMRLVGPDVYGEPPDPANSLAVLRRAVELGVNFIDTAEAYGPEINERQIYEALAPYPPQLVIATKCGIDRRARDWGQTRTKGSPSEIRASCEGSLQRLQVERIDLYQLHRIDPAVPIEDSVGALAGLRREGKVRHIGLSEVSAEQLERARTVAPIATVQNRYNVADREHEAVLDHCEANGVGFIPWYPLGSGSLCAAGGPLDSLARRIGATTSQVALAWLLARSAVVLPIPGTSSLMHLEQNVAAARVRLTAEDLSELNRLADAACGAGEQAG
ncbi:MAG TPA: aldo/keto reductase [Allosphingosinicella sp.]|jgi:aryl-alcohol dehydrogenase-like predicted oxidoreductase|uniref:aldo/keto reductase n=1 Tax=Allosphingosinicella sp. TaxID=2823234 RepID=UPI002F2A65E1